MGQATSGTRLGEGLSLHLDTLRLLAAAEVVVFHLARLKTGVPLAWWNAFGHEAVVIFFVLSGFVIRSAADGRDRDPRVYAVSRVTRVWSVALPCLALTWLFDTIGRHADAAYYGELATHGSALVRLAIGAAMLNESWFLSVQMLSNTPYWSIAYEFWYYALFGALFFTTGRARIAAATLVAAIAGPKILLLFPIWALGWWAMRTSLARRLPGWLRWALFVQPALVLIAYQSFDLIHVGQRWLEAPMGPVLWRNGLVWSRYVLSDTLLGLSVALHLVAARGLEAPLRRVLAPIAVPVRWGAARSFTLYLLHQPAMLMMGALIPTAVAWRGIAVSGSTVAIVVLVAAFTEAQRGRLRRPVAWAVDRIAALVTARARYPAARATDPDSPAYSAAPGSPCGPARTGR